MSFSPLKPLLVSHRDLSSASLHPAAGTLARFAAVRAAGNLLSDQRDWLLAQAREV